MKDMQINNLPNGDWEFKEIKFKGNLLNRLVLNYAPLIQTKE